MSNRPAKRSRTASRLAAMFGLCALLAACGTSPNAPSSVGARDTGTFPNLNIKPGEANKQLTEQQRRAKTNELKAALGANSQQGTPPPNDVPALQKLASTHGRDTVAEIEKKAVEACPQQPCPPATEPVPPAQ